MIDPGIPKTWGTTSGTCLWAYVESGSSDNELANDLVHFESGNVFIKLTLKMHVRCFTKRNSINKLECFWFTIIGLRTVNLLAYKTEKPRSTGSGWTISPNIQLFSCLPLNSPGSASSSPPLPRIKAVYSFIKIFYSLPVRSTFSL